MSFLKFTYQQRVKTGQPLLLNETPTEITFAPGWNLWWKRFAVCIVAALIHPCSRCHMTINTCLPLLTSAIFHSDISQFFVKTKLYWRRIYKVTCIKYIVNLTKKTGVANYVNQEDRCRELCQPNQTVNPRAAAEPTQKWGGGFILFLCIILFFLKALKDTWIINHISIK